MIAEGREAEALFAEDLFNGEDDLSIVAALPSSRLGEADGLRRAGVDARQGQPFVPVGFGSEETLVVAFSHVLFRTSFIVGFPGETAYCASKHAQVGFAKALDREVFDKGVKVSVA